MRLTLLISLLLAIAAVVFSLQNPGVADVNVFGLSYTGSKALILIITFAVGVVVGVLATFPAYFRNRRKVNSLKKTLAEDRVEARRERETRPPAEAPAHSQGSQDEGAPPPSDTSSTS